MAVFLALCSAAAVGTSDFLGGFASRHTKAVTAAAYSNAVGTLFFIIAAPIAGGSLVGDDLAWSIGSGVAGALGILALYRGIGVARVSIVSPMAGVGAAALPVIVSATTGDDLSALSLVGIGLGLVAIALVTRARSDHVGSVSASVLYGAGAGLGLGTLLAALGQTSGDAGLWPLLPSRAAGMLTLVIILVLMRQPLSLPRQAARPSLGSGVLAASGNALFLAGAQIGSLAVVAVVTAMFPAVTVLWARGIFGERLNRTQLVGLMLALISVALIAGG
jgi:drug/metabolite transporter (DMT)-like permease